MSGTVQFSSIGTVASASSVVELKNVGVLSNTGNIVQNFNYSDSQYADYISSGNTSVNASLNLKMNAANVGEGVQNFNSNTLFFTGGVTVVGGKLALNFDQSVSKYYYTTNFKSGAIASGTNKWTDYTRTDFTKTQNSDETDIVTTASHGDLLMQGGVFANTRDTGDGVQSFQFSNINYEGGTIQLDMYEFSNDYLDITNDYYVRTSLATHATGSAVVITYSDYNYVKATAGTITIADGQKMTFQLEGDLNWLLKTAESDPDFKGERIIAWADGAASGYDASDFAANSFITSGGDVANAVFTLESDGLYVAYAAVPEPATYAALFGVLALGMAVYRRRK